MAFYDKNKEWDACAQACWGGREGEEGRAIPAPNGVNVTHLVGPPASQCHRLYILRTSSAQVWFSIYAIYGRLEDFYPMILSTHPMGLILRIEGNKNMCDCQLLNRKTALGVPNRQNLPRPHL